MARKSRAGQQHRKTPKTVSKRSLSAPARKPRLLWANPFCMMDTSSGASISVRQILIQLQRAGYEVDIVGATVFDNPRGVERMFGIWKAIQADPSEIVTVNDGALTHHLVKTKQLQRDQMTVKESNLFYQAYVSRLNGFRPDVVFFYGGQSADFLIPAEARARGIPSMAYLVNAHYTASRWCRDVDLIITDTQATSDFYTERVGFRPVPVGKFIDPADVIATQHQRRHVTLINPSWAKGAGIVAMLALLLEEKRPDITFEVVESRGSWKEVVRAVTGQVTGTPRDALRNVIVTPNTSRMADVYERSRVVLGLSQWWESGSRVLAEAMLNGIPAIVSNSGGSPEMVGDGGIVVDLPPECHEAPYTTLPKPDRLGPIANLIEQIWDDEMFHLLLMTKALQQGMALHRIEHSTKRLLAAMTPLVDQRAGDNDPFTSLQASHKHGLSECPVVPPNTAKRITCRPQSLPETLASVAQEKTLLETCIGGPLALELSRAGQVLTLTFEDEIALSELRPNGCVLAALASDSGRLWLASKGVSGLAEVAILYLDSPIHACVYAQTNVSEANLTRLTARLKELRQTSSDETKIGYVLFGNSDCASARLRGQTIAHWLDKQANISSVILSLPNTRYEPDLSEPDGAMLCARIMLGNFSTVIFQKVCGAAHMQAMRLCQFLNVRVVYDDCDPRSEFPHKPLVDHVTVSTPALAKDLAVRFGIHAEVIEDVIDFAPPIRATYDSSRANRGVWIGTSDKFDYFTRFRDRMCDAAPEIAVSAISDHPQADIRWDGSMFPEILKNFGFGLVTLEENDWARTKSPNRATLLMANGLPVICESHPAYKDVISSGHGGFLVDTPEEAAARALELRDPITWKTHSEFSAVKTLLRFGIDQIGPRWLSAVLMQPTQQREAQCKEQRKNAITEGRKSK